MNGWGYCEANGVGTGRCCAVFHNSMTNERTNIQQYTGTSYHFLLSQAECMSVDLLRKIGLSSELRLRVLAEQ